MVVDTELTDTDSIGNHQFWFLFWHMMNLQVISKIS